MPLDRARINEVFYASGNPPDENAADPGFSAFNQATIEEIGVLQGGLNSNLQEEREYLNQVLQEFLQHHQRNMQKQAFQTQLKALKKNSRSVVSRTLVEKDKQRGFTRQRGDTIDEQSTVPTTVATHEDSMRKQKSRLKKQKSQHNSKMQRQKSRAALQKGVAVPQRWLVSVSGGSSQKQLMTTGLTTCLGFHVYDPDTNTHSLAHFDNPDPKNTLEYQRAFLQDMVEKGLLSENSEVTLMYKQNASGADSSPEDASLINATKQALSELNVTSVREVKRHDLSGVIVDLTRADASQPFAVQPLDFSGWDGSNAPNSGTVGQLISTDPNVEMYFLDPEARVLRDFASDDTYVMGQGSDMGTVPLPSENPRGTLSNEAPSQDSTNNTMTSQASSVFASLGSLSQTATEMGSPDNPSMGTELLTMSNKVREKPKQDVSDDATHAATLQADIDAQMQTDSSPPQVESEDNARKTGMGNK